MTKSAPLRRAFLFGFRAKKIYSFALSDSAMSMRRILELSRRSVTPAKSKTRKKLARYEYHCTSAREPKSRYTNTHCTSAQPSPTPSAAPAAEGAQAADDRALLLDHAGHRRHDDERGDEDEEHGEHRRDDGHLFAVALRRGNALVLLQGEHGEPSPNSAESAEAVSSARRRPCRAAKRRACSPTSCPGRSVSSPIGCAQANPRPKRILLQKSAV